MGLNTGSRLKAKDLSRAKDRTFKPKTTAMAAKITNQLWTIKQLLGHKIFVN